MTMSCNKPQAVVEVPGNKPQAVCPITMSSGGKIRSVVLKGFFPVGEEVFMKVAGETVGDPSGPSVCIDIDYPIVGTNGKRLAVEKLEDKELRDTNGYLFPVKEPASLQPGIRDLLQVVNADTVTEARMGLVWKMLSPWLVKASEGTHDWMNEVVGMGVMGMSASAGYGTQCVVAKATCALAFASTATAFWLPRNWMTTIRVLSKVGAVACIGGILEAIGHDLPHEYKWWVVAAAFLPPAAAVVVA